MGVYSSMYSVFANRGHVMIHAAINGLCCYSGLFNYEGSKKRRTASEGRAWKRIDLNIVASGCKIDFFLYRVTLKLFS